MAIVVQVPVTPASRADFDSLEATMETVMAADGGPPVGLMVHLAWPEGEGFRLCQVWRAEGEMRSYVEETVLPQLAAAGLAHGELTTSPVWSLARP